MRTLRTTTLILILPGLLTGCASTSGVAPRIRTVASVGDKPLPVVTGTPGSSVRAEVATPDRPRRTDGRISGRVVDDKGEPMPNVRVRLAVENTSAGKIITAKTDHTGAFTLRGVRPGKNYTVIAEDEEAGLSGRVEAEAPDTDVRISLVAAGTEAATPTRTSRKAHVNMASDREPIDETEEEPSSSKPKVNLEDIEPPPATAAEAMNEEGNFRSPTRAQQTAARSPRWRAGSAKPADTGKNEPNLDGGGGGSAKEGGGGSSDLNHPTASPPPDDDGNNPLPPAREPGHTNQTSQAEPGREMMANASAAVVSTTAADSGVLPTPAETAPTAPAETTAPATELASKEPASLAPASEPATQEPAGLIPASELASKEPEIGAAPQEVMAPQGGIVDASAASDSGLLANPLAENEKVAAASPAPAVSEATPLPETNTKANPVVINPAGSSLEDLEKLAEAASTDVVPPAAAAPAAVAAAPAAVAEVAAAEEDPFIAAAKTQQPAPPGEVVTAAQPPAGELIEAPAAAPTPAPEKPAPAAKKRPTWRELASTAKSASAAGAASATSDGFEGRPRLSSIPGAGGLRMRSGPAPIAQDDGKSFCDFDPKTHRIKDFRLPDLEGKPVRFQDIDTDLVLIDFWGTWCRPCIRTVPRLVELQKKMGGQKLTVVGIACEEGPPELRAQKVAKEAKRLGINYPILMSGIDGPCPLQEALDVKALPTLVLVDRQGRVVWRDQGATPMTLAKLDRFLASTIASEGVRRY